MHRLTPYIVISLLVHLLLVLLIQFFRPFPSFTPEAAAPIWIDLKNGKYEIADIEQPSLEQKPKDARFLGLYDSSAPQEEVAQRQGRGKKETRDSRLETRVQKPKDQNLLQFDKGLFAAKEKAKSKSPLEDGTPSEALPEDFYPDFRRGTHTYLNVMRYPEVQYFVRLKRAFKMTFDPLAGLRDAYLNNQISRGQIETVLGVSLDAKGNLAEVFIFKSSGVDRYDQEALRTIRASAPFSTPPGKFLDQDGLLRMSWTFTVYL